MQVVASCSSDHARGVVAAAQALIRARASSHVGPGPTSACRDVCPGQNLAASAVRTPPLPAARETGDSISALASCAVAPAPSDDERAACESGARAALPAHGPLGMRAKEHALREALLRGLPRSAERE